jgi:carlactone synthase/all-trans-10'-apo-beta-carotenal 13,14-cleaving dioxygenase
MLVKEKKNPITSHVLCNCAVQNGTYLRNGPGLWEVGDHSSHHIFDGYATLVRISFRRGCATGAHRQVESDAYKAARAHGRPLHREFSQLCPSEPGTLLDRVRDVVGLASGTLLTDNANVSVLPLGDGRVLCLTEATKGSVLIDPETLDTIGKFRYADRLWGLLQSAHPVVTGNELLTLLPDMFRRGHRVVRMAAGSNERKMVGRVHCRGGQAPGWVHSFAVTEKYIVVPEMPLRYSLAGVLKSQMTPWYLFDWLPESGSYMHAICRFTGKTVSNVNVTIYVFVNVDLSWMMSLMFTSTSCRWRAWRFLRSWHYTSLTHTNKEMRSLLTAASTMPILLSSRHLHCVD